MDWITHYGCYYVVHGDDITSDSDGDDCYRFVKEAGRFRVVKRTPGISTTDLVGRMLLCTRGHFIKSFLAYLAGKEGSGTPEELAQTGKESFQRVKDYASDESGLRPGADVWVWVGTQPSIAAQTEGRQPGRFDRLVQGKGARPGQRIVYVDGGFDLFSSGHIEFLRQVHAVEEERGIQSGWYAPERINSRMRDHGEDYGPVYVIAGVHDDEVINYWKGLNYPIMNIFERGLCVLQCRVSRFIDKRRMSSLFPAHHPLTARIVHSCSSLLCAFHTH